MSPPASSAPFTPPPPGEFIGHPRGLWMLFGSEFWERFAYYGMRALLAVYVATTFFSLLPENEGRAQASLTYGAYTALIYATGIFGGSVADRYLGYRHSIMLGGAVMGLGLFLLMIPDLTWFLIGLSVIVVGNGLFKPNISSMVGMLYAPGDARRDSGFTIFYMGINAGGALAPLLCGTLIGAHFGYRWGFFTAGVGMILALWMFHWLRGWLGHIGAPPVTQGAMLRVFKVLLACLLAVPLVYFLLSEPKLVTRVLIVVFLLLAGYFVFSGIKSGNKAQLHCYIAMLLLFLAKILFWGMFEQSGSSLNFFAKDHVDAPFDFTLFQSANPVLIVLLGPLFAWLWPRLESRGINPSIPAKFGIAILLVALGFSTLVLAINAAPGADTRIHWSILGGAYLINTMGELCLSPIGLSMVTKLAAPRDVGLAMGAWFMCTAMGNSIAGEVAATVFASDQQLPGIYKYGATFEHIVWAGVIFGTVLLLTSPLIKRLMHGVK